MIWQSFKYDGQEVSRITPDWEILADVERRKITTSDETKKIDWRHGVRLSPTFQRGRKITISWMIVADSRAKSAEAMEYLDQLFALQEQGGKTEFKPFIVVDDKGVEREIAAKIKTPLEYSIWEFDHIDGDGRTFRVVLEAEDARLFTTRMTEVRWAETKYGGFKLWVKLGHKMNAVSSAIRCEAVGNMETPARIEITALGPINAPLIIKKGGSFFALNIDAAVWDKILIDSKQRTATKNGQNILAQRIPGSSWPTIKWTTVFTIVDKDWGLYSSDFDVKIYFANVLL